MNILCRIAVKKGVVATSHLVQRHNLQVVEDGNNDTTGQHDGRDGAQQRYAQLRPVEVNLCGIPCTSK